MPTSIEILLDPISIFVVIMYAILMLWEAFFPGRKLLKIKGWKLRGLTAFVIFFFLSSYLPIIWDQYLANYQIFDLTDIGILGGTMVGLFIYELGIYLWHRCIHKYDILWKTFHQMHHSAENLDTYGTFYFSPLDMIGWTFLGSLSLTLIVGVDPQAATLILLLTTFFAIFQHANINTPVWLGYFIQRPESHTIHHGKNIHAYNYSDLPLFDILFGTFKNPKEFEVETGFYNDASKRLLDMLLFRDISHASNKYHTSNKKLNASAQAYTMENNS